MNYLDYESDVHEIVRLAASQVRKALSEYSYPKEGDDIEEVRKLMSIAFLKGALSEIGESVDYDVSDAIESAFAEATLVFDESIKTKRANKLLESVETEDVIEQFCILMDWEIEPEDVVKCEKIDDGKYEITAKDGLSFIYDSIDDCLE